MKNIRSYSQLLETKVINKESDSKLQKLEAVLDKYAMSITPQMLELIKEEKDLEEKPITQQFVPTVEELNTLEEELYDPTGDFAYTPVKGIVHRYQDRCLLKPVSVCSVYCRFCFRREFIGPNQESLSLEDLKKAYEYIASNPNIFEVILTGGDPLILKPKQIMAILKALSEIPHVEVIRIHTRIPIIDSDKITDEMLEALQIEKSLFLAIHANHPKEFTEKAKLTCHRIAHAGIPMVSQSVLLKGINNDVETLGLLMRTFVKNKIKPYYLHHPDMAKGTSHFRVTIEEGRELVQALRQNYSGLCQPTYIKEIPGGFGKIPIF